MNSARLVEMANDIAAFFAADPDRIKAIDSVANHLVKFWEPRMRREIAAHVRQGGEGLSEIAKAAVERIEG